MLKVLSIESDFLGRSFLSPDGRYSLSLAPGQSVRLHEIVGNLMLRQFLPDVFVAELVAFNFEDGVTTKCALLTNNGSAITVIDLVRKAINQPCVVSNVLSLAYDNQGSIFAGTNDGVLLRLTDEVPGNLTVADTFNVADCGLVLVAPTLLEPGMLSVFTDSGEWFSVDSSDGKVMVHGREDDEAWMIQSMSFHPTMPVFAMWRRNGDILLASPQGTIDFNFVPVEEFQNQGLQSILVVDFNRVFAVTRNHIVELAISDELDSDQLPIIYDRVLFSCPFGQRIIAATQVPGSIEMNLTVLTTYS